MADINAQAGQVLGVAQPPVANNQPRDFSDIKLLANQLDQLNNKQEALVSGLGSLNQGLATEQGAIAQGKQKQEEVEASGREAARRKQVADEQAAQQEYKRLKDEQPLPAFVPTKDSGMDLAKLMSSMAVMGTLMGRSGGGQSAINAMASMKGMMEGWQQGRQDLYKKEADEFTKNYNRMLKIHGEFRQEMEDAIKLASTNKEAGYEAAHFAAVKVGSDIVKHQVNEGNFKAAIESVKAMDKLVADMKKTVAKQLSDVQKRENDLEVARIRAQGAVNVAQQRAAGSSSSKGWKAYKTKLGQIIRYNSATGEIEGGNVEDLANATTLGTVPKGVTQQTFIAQRAVNALGGVASAVETIVELPEGSTTGWLPNLQTKDGMINAVRNSLGRKISKVDAEFMNTLFKGLGRNLATIESSGLATGLATLANQLESGVYINAGVDDPYKVAMKLADIRRVAVENIQPAIDSGLMPEQQAETARKLVKRIEEIIPYSTIDVAKAYNQSRIPKPTIGQSTTKVVSPSAPAWTESDENRLQELEKKLGAK
jgi:hypothetical protein